MSPAEEKRSMPGESPRTRLCSAAPVFQVGDITRTMRWYEAHLGFRADPFPEAPPYVFCILTRDAVEIMLQRVDAHETLDTYRRRAGGVWHVYLRMEGVHALYEAVRQEPEVVVLEPLRRQPYGDTEFVVQDPNGYVLVFSELVTEGA
jgi:catechol 2,3-dioxygenase-like lactoylglutathione lyase family enzyme